MARSMYRLLFQSRTTARSPITSDAACLLIGRTAACGLQLTEPGVSDQHAAIDRRSTGYFIRDLTHSNGVHVNGTAITDQRLTTGDELELGAVRLVFEVVHEPPPERRAFDLWQFLGAGIIALLVAGQLALLGWILLQPHPRQARTDIVARKPTTESAPLPPVATTLPDLAPLTTETSSPTSAPVVLSRMLKIVQFSRPDPATLRIVILARVGERQLDPRAITVSVQCFHSTQPSPIQWLPVPISWENFKSKELIAHLPGLCDTFVVRTYYRQQPQDAAGNGLPPSP